MIRLTALLSLTLIGTATASPTIEAGDWTLKLTGQLRPRLVADSNINFADDDKAIAREYVTQRTRLGFGVAHKTGPKMFVQLQDVRIWGEEPNTLSYSAAGLDLHQAYVDFPMTLLTARIGRQEIIFDDARLVGNVGWAQRARTFDALRLMLDHGNHAVDIFMAVTGETDQNKDGHVGATGKPSWFGGIHGKWLLSDALSASFAVYSRRKGAADETRHTLGTYLKGAASGINYEGQFWYQLGDMAGESIGAWMGAARVGYTIDTAWKPMLMVWGEALSGDGTPEAAFDTLFATNHKFYGEMDQFINIPVHTGNLGLMDIGGRIAVAPADTVKLHVDTHIFRSLEPDAADESSFGTEIDLAAAWKMGKGVSGRALFGLFLPGDTMAGRGVPVDDLTAEQLFFLTLNWKI